MPDVWEGFIKWEKYPEKCQVAYGLMKATQLPPPPGVYIALVISVFVIRLIHDGQYRISIGPLAKAYSNPLQ